MSAINSGGDEDYVNTSYSSYDGNQFDFESPIMQRTRNVPEGPTYDTLSILLDQPGMAKPCNGETYAPRKLLEAMTRRNTLAVKQAASQQGEGTSLNRVLQWYHLMGYGFAATVGAGTSLVLCYTHPNRKAGIFVVAGQVANQTAGPGIIFSFLIAAFSSLLSAFCYSEYAVRVPLSGSAYTFSYVTLGELIGFLYVSSWITHHSSLIIPPV